MDDLPDLPPDWTPEAQAELDRIQAAGHGSPAAVYAIQEATTPRHKDLVAVADYEQTGAMSVPYLTASLRKPAGEIVRSIAALEAYPIATATPEERADLLELRVLLDTVASAARIRIGAIDLAFKRGMEELAARELVIDGWGSVRYAPDEGEWEVHAESLRAELSELVKYGVVTEEDIIKAFKVVVTVTADNRVLNGLMKRGTAVQQAIERHRTKREPRPLSGKLTLPKRRRVADEE